MRIFICAMGLSAVAIAGSIGGSQERNPVRTQPHTQVPTGIHQVIVKLRAADVAPGGSDNSQLRSPQQRIKDLSARTGLTLQDWHAITERLHAVRFEVMQSGDSIVTTIARLKSDPEVEYAEADGRRFAHQLPTDPLFLEVSPTNSGQWYMQNDPATPAAVDAVAAWDVTTGNPNLVIADLDTGVLFNHPDLLAVTASGRLLQGWDFITDPAVANDGDGRDGDASDPGDFVTAQDATQAPFNSGCIPSGQTNVDSSWHGTRTAGILGALTNNAKGIAGMTWQAKILPVRVLGKCGGVDSDIIAAMLWAAGIHVDGVPDNQNPAKILNMSFGATGSCTQAYSETISQVAAKGALVVVSAGNEGGPVDVPANCPGVAGVAGIRHAGTKVGFSSLGPEIALSAPAGNCVNTTGGSICEYSIETTTNNGLTAPNANTYTDQLNDTNLGTSFSAPIVSGIAALMASANSHLNSCQLLARLKEGSKPFPQTSAGESSQPLACHVPTSATDLQTAECICTLDGKTCGAGMANANGAVAAALRPIAVVTVPASVTAGSSVALSAQGSAAANGHTISAYQWTNVGAQAAAIQNGTTAAPTITAPACGFATVELAVTDDSGREDTADVVLSPTSATSMAPGSITATTCDTTTPAVMLAVCPASSSVQAGNGSQTFTASVANTANASVTWQVNGVVGGNTTVGTITSAGVYTAPATVPSPSTVTIEAISAADATVSSSTQVSITAPPAPSHGGGSMDPVTLLFETLVVGAGLLLRRPRVRALKAL
jgi:serine protease